MGWNNSSGLEALKGKVIIDISGLEAGSDKILFECEDGEKFRMYHCQDCCECASIEDIVGNIEDLKGSPILMAEEVSEDDPNACDLGMWTFYKLATIKGYVTIRWYGTSNGYYSVSVNFERVN